VRLTDLEPTFLRIEQNSPRGERVFGETDTMQGADGVMFLCPKCFQANAGPVGTHVMICWRPHVPLTFTPQPGRWEFAGTGYGDLTLNAPPGLSARSVQIQGGCLAHFHITNGEVTNA